MSSSQGSFQLTCRAFAGRAWPVPGKPRSVVLDVVFPNHNLDGTRSDVNCSLRFFKGDEAVVISDEIYDIVTTVLLFMVILSELISSVSKVVAFRPQINEPSPYIGDDQFALMGDLSEVISECCVEDGNTYPS